MRSQINVGGDQELVARSRSSRCVITVMRTRHELPVVKQAKGRAGRLISGLAAKSSKAFGTQAAGRDSIDAAKTLD